MLGIIIGSAAAVSFVAAGVRIVRPTHKMLVETLGKYSATKVAGFHWIFPIVQSSRHVEITETMVDVPPQMVVTKDKLNCEVDAVVFYQVQDVVKAEYNVASYRDQIVTLARTNLRAVLGGMTFADANTNRAEINEKVETLLDKETIKYGVDILRVELQKLEAPKHVQEAMNQVVIANQQKTAALDFATAKETEADGIKRAEIKKAEGVKQSRILQAEGEAEAITKIAEAESKKIQLVNTAAEKYFKGNAQKLEALRAAERALKKNSKIIVDSKTKISTLVTDLAGAQVAPVK